MRDIIKILITTNCELLVSPRTDLNDPGYVYLEFMVSENVDSYETLELSECPQLYRYYFEEDGVYMYYRLKIVTKSLLEDVELENRLYYDDVSDKLMIGNKELISSEQLKDIVDDDYPETSYGIIEFVERPVFSICRISNCLENLQRKYIFDGCPSKKNCKEDSDKLNRDFLFSSVFILRLLIQQQRYEEALRILESINDCGVVCSNMQSPSINTCGCK